MKLPKRANDGAPMVAGVRLTRRAAAVVAALALAWSTGNLYAAPASHHAHVRHVSREGETGPGHAKSAHKNTHKSSERHSTEHATAKSHSRAGARHHHAEPEPVDDAIPMHRASREDADETDSAEMRHELAVARRERRAGTGERLIETIRVEKRRIVRRPVRQEVAAEHHTAPVPPREADQPEQAADTSTHSLTVDDFVRAATGVPAAQTPAVQRASSGVDAKEDSQPQAESTKTSTNPTTTAAVTKPQPPLPQVAPVQPPSAPATTTAKRVDGFGAEGAPTQVAAKNEAAAPNHRTLARTMAEYRAEMKSHKQAPELSGAEQNAITDAAVQPEVLPAIYDHGGHLVMPAPLKGSREVLVHQNTMADSEGLERIQTDTELVRLEDEHELVRLPESVSLHVNPDLPVERRYARPWTVRFAEETARAFQQRFGEPLEVNSAVRTVHYQLRLQRVNGNAAAVEGDTASPHLTGQAIDIGKRGMSRAQLAWMRAYLLPLMQSGKIDVEEEFQQACFHISVYRTYAPERRRSLRFEMANQFRRAAAAEAETPATFAPPATDDDQ